MRAARIPVTDTHHGVGVTDDYRRLEDAPSEETIAWTKAQRQRTRAYFEGIRWRDALRAVAGAGRRLRGGRHPRRR